MPMLPWQVVTHWLLPTTGGEYTHTAAFDSVDEARGEMHRLSSFLGKFVEGQVLRSIEIQGDTEVVLHDAISL